MTDDAKEEIENARNTFKARAKGKLKKWYIQGNTASSLDTVADQFRKEAEIIFTDDEALEAHRQYVELLVDAGEQAVEKSSYSLHDPSTWNWSRDEDTKERKRDGDLFEQAIDDLREQHQSES